MAEALTVVREGGCLTSILNTTEEAAKKKKKSHTHTSGDYR
jgi:hypothetical protein